jgi:tRNA-modifying protein YgfZ
MSVAPGRDKPPAVSEAASIDKRRHLPSGKLKRRMQLGSCTAGAKAGADVFAAGDAEAVGTVVMSAVAPTGGFDLLFECPLDKAETPLHLGAPDGPPLALRALPYELIDVTA